MSSTSSELTGSWSASSEETERIIGLQLQGRRGIIMQALGPSPVVSAAAVPDERAAAGGGVRAGAASPLLFVFGLSAPFGRQASSEAAAAASRRHATGSGTGGSGDDADAAAAPSPPGLTADMALSILVDCFGH